MLGLRIGIKSAVTALALLSSVALSSAKDTLTLGLPIEPTGLDPTTRRSPHPSPFAR